jgi:hemerythrin
LVWIDAFSIGNPEIDADHRVLVADAASIVELIRAKRPWPEIEAQAQLMARRCVEHFRREEAILEREKFPEASAHRQEHARIECEMQSAVARLDSAGGRTPADMVGAALYFREMLVDHLLRYDLAYKSHVLDRHGR